MKLVIRDTWFPSGTQIDIEAGQDELAFVRCTFEGGEIVVDAAVDRPIFLGCLFQGTRFSGQPLSARISRECHWCAPATEASASVPVGMGRNGVRPR
ncbi:MAG: hypothetical protein WBN86_07325 [Porticoccaceae bacterium]